MFGKSNNRSNIGSVLTFSLQPNITSSRESCMLDMSLQDCNNHCKYRFQKVWTMLHSQSKCSIDSFFSLSILFNFNATNVFVVRILCSIRY